MHRLPLLALIFALSSLSFVVGISSEQEQISVLQQENRELKDQLEQLNKILHSRSSVQVRDEPTKESACKCHYCADDVITPGACTTCEGYCDICEFCETPNPLVSATKCASLSCTGAGYNDADPPLPVPLPNQAEVCTSFYSMTTGGADTYHNQVEWRYNIMDVTSTVRLVSVKVRFGMDTGTSPSIIVPARGALWKSVSSTQKFPDAGPGGLVQAFDKINTQGTTQTWYTFHPEGKNSVTLTPGRYFFAFAHAVPTGNPMARLLYSMYPAGTIPVNTPAGVTIYQGRWYTARQDKALDDYATVSWTSTTERATNYAWVPEFSS